MTSFIFGALSLLPLMFFWRRPNVVHAGFKEGDWRVGSGGGRGGGGIDTPPRMRRACYLLPKQRTPLS